MTNPHPYPRRTNNPLATHGRSAAAPAAGAAPCARAGGLFRDDPRTGPGSHDFAALQAAWDDAARLDGWRRTVAQIRLLARAHRAEAPGLALALALAALALLAFATLTP